eukprot:CAMPEP_0117534110 /NCGR_PEP_ID=MMETSP0784-20121206/40240_1 /TAXON_ID=39447 /ORGANISM="" /LENGTH=37 /DNA_ID= /DNA_START= /DNA_END= /DNA_ORIENTATION=
MDMGTVKTNVNDAPAPMSSTTSQNNTKIFASRGKTDD